MAQGAEGEGGALAAWGEGRPVASLPLPPMLLKKLLQCGYSSTGDLEGVTPADLSREAGISQAEAVEVLMHLTSFSKRYSDALVGAKSARQLLQEEAERPARISTMCAQLDAVLGGGVPCCELTEICGAPGIGKTQLCMQLALSVQVPTSLGGAGGQAVYVDTEGSFMTERAVQMAQGMVRKLSAQSVPPTSAHGASDRGGQAEQPLALPGTSSLGPLVSAELVPAGSREKPSARDELQQMRAQGRTRGEEGARGGEGANTALSLYDSAGARGSPRWSPSSEELLQNIHFFRVLSCAEQLAVCNMLPAFLEAHPQVRLVVLDSVTFQFRQSFEDMFQRTRVLLSMGQQLLSVAHKYRVAVVLTNHVTTRVVNGVSHLAPALGEGWSHTSTNRVILFWKDEQRYAHILKSPYLAPATAPFFVTEDGIRGYQEDTEAGEKRTRY